MKGKERKKYIKSKRKNELSKNASLVDEDVIHSMSPSSRK